MSDDDAGEGGVRQQRRRRMSPRPLYQSGDTSKRGFLRLLLRWFKEFQKEVVASLSDPDNNILQQYEGLVPSIVDSQVEVATWLGEISNRVAIGQEKAENSFAQQQQVNSRMESMLLGVNQQLQQVCRNQQMLIVNQHYLGYQVQSLMMANMPVNDSNFVPPAPSSSSSSTFVPLPPPHVPLLLPPIPHSTPPPLPPSPPPHPSSIDPNRNSSRPSTKSKGKKWARWISYDPEA
ncbi:hypothetical protein BDA99DRAFT_540338 [Phascolomyces articulosus]|uniref:Uncharacterized protein n=1 Tax=Phascolomyces articulosus TaxID=60185 RepID=A0AAD5PBB8_9FUNG|nr:hypothetical protein BDA99DRAFT_540338 [Phascolomyces articulosus]